MLLDETFELGYILKTHGLRGHVAAQFDVDDANVYKNLKTLYLTLRDKPAQLVPHQIEKVQFQTAGRVLLKLQGMLKSERGREMGRKRHDFMLSFLQQIESEM